jgi:thiamine monophosphate synthase
MAGAPVVAIGGILEPWQAEAAARCGVDGVCVVRALGDDPALTVPAFADAMNLPHPTL